MFSFKKIRAGALISLWFVFLTFPIMVIKVDPLERIVYWRWDNAVMVGVGTFLIYLIVEYFKYRKEHQPEEKAAKNEQHQSFIHRVIGNPKQRNILLRSSWP